MLHIVTANYGERGFKRCDVIGVHGKELNCVLAYAGYLPVMLDILIEKL